MNDFNENIVNALPYDIVRRVRQKFVTNDDVNDGDDSVYIDTNGKKYEIRVSNHCTHLWTWHQRKYGDSDDITRISIVFEDKDTFTNRNLVLKKPRKTKLHVMEFVYRITDPNSFTPQDVKTVMNTINRCLKRQEMYEDETGKLTYAKERISINPIYENKQYRNTNMIMKQKQTIKLNESKLRQIIKESIKKVLKEDDCRYEETEEFANLEDEILQYISSEKYEQMCRNLTQKKANKMIEKHLSKMEEMLARGEGKDYVGDMTYDWLAFWYGVDNGTSKNGRVNLYVMEKNPSIQYQYSNEKYPNIPVEKARERITEVIKTYYEYAVKSAIPTIEQLKEILSIVKQYS